MGKKKAQQPPALTPEAMMMQMYATMMAQSMSGYNSQFTQNSVSGKKAKQTKKKKAAQSTEEASDGEQVEMLPGQKFVAPPEGDGTRVFYESLLMQKPWSEMANKYCIEHGLHPNQTAMSMCSTQESSRVPRNH